VAECVLSCKIVSCVGPHIDIDYNKLFARFLLGTGDAQLFLHRRRYRAETTGLPALDETQWLSLIQKTKDIL